MTDDQVPAVKEWLGTIEETGFEFPKLEPWQQGKELVPDHAYLFVADDMPSVVVRGDTIIELKCGCRALVGIRLDNGETAFYVGGGEGHEDLAARALERWKELPTGEEGHLKLWEGLHDEEVARGQED